MTLYLHVKNRPDTYSNLSRYTSGLTLLLAFWMPWQDLAKFLLHLGNHGSHGKILTKILPRCIIIRRSNLTKMETILRFQSFNEKVLKWSYLYEFFAGSSGRHFSA